MNRLILIILVSSTLWKCTNNNIDSHRIEMIRTMVSAIQEYDTSELYTLVDTVYYNRIFWKDKFTETIGFVNKNFKEHGIMSFDSITTVKTGPNIEYLLPLRKNPGEFANKLVIGFANYEKDKILFFDVRGNILDQDSATLKKLVPNPENTLQPKKQ